VIQETRIFSTKERAPFYLCLEVFNPEMEEKKHEEKKERMVSEFNISISMFNDM
jgi:phosphatidylinositol 4-kinase